MAVLALRCRGRWSFLRKTMASRGIGTALTMALGLREKVDPTWIPLPGSQPRFSDRLLDPKERKDTVVVGQCLGLLPDHFALRQILRLDP
jgi:hypothetical protein